MSELQEKKTQIIEARNALESICSHNSLMRLNRYLLFMVLALMFVVMVLGILWVPKQTITPTFRSSSKSVFLSQTNTVLTDDVNALKSQMIGLVSGSIESKLRMLEESIRMGASAHSLGTIEDMKNDLRVLRSYSQPAKKINPEGIADNEQLLEEISQLRTLIYVSLASCGLMLAAVAGIWLKNSNKLTYIKVITHYLGRH